MPVWARQAELGLTGRKCKRWTDGQRAILDAEIDMMAARLAERFGRTKGSIIGEMNRSLVRWPRRRRRALILDLGGMSKGANKETAA